MAISFSSPVNRDARARGAGVTAVLGPTNTGKTHLAIERMLGHSSGIIGLPLFITAVAARSATSRGGGSVTRAKLPAEGGRPPGAGGGLDVIWEWRTAACGWPATGQT